MDSSNEIENPSHLTSAQTTSLVDKVQTWRYRVDARQHGFFLVKRIWASQGQASASDLKWDVSSLAGYETGFFKDTDPTDRFVAFVDPSTYPQSPGWMLRNLLVLVRQRWGLENVQILCYRDVQSKRDEPRSIIVRLQRDVKNPETSPAQPEPGTKSPKMPKVTGWERNKEGKLASRIANLGDYLDPYRYDLLL